MIWIAILTFFIGGAFGFFTAVLVASSKLRELDENYRRLIELRGKEKEKQ